jgi:hypothetical protein
MVLDGGPVKSDVSSADIIMVVQSCRAGRIIAMLCGIMVFQALYSDFILFWCVSLLPVFADRSTKIRNFAPRPLSPRARHEVFPAPRSLGVGRARAQRGSGIRG